jgi:hypothetical protein
MVDLAPPNVGRCQRYISTEEKGNRDVLPAAQPYLDWLTPASVARLDGDLDVSRIEAGGAELNRDPISNETVVFTAFPRNPSADCSRGLLADPYVHEAAQLDDAEQNRQEHEGHGQHRLERLLPRLVPKPPAFGHEVWVSRCTI